MTLNRDNKIIEQLKGYLDELSKVRFELSEKCSIIGLEVSIYEKMLSWKEKVEGFLEDSGLFEEAHELSQKPPPKSKWINELAKKIDIYYTYLKSIVYKMEIGFYRTLPSQKGKIVGVVKSVETNKVFIVHGHDEANLYKLRDLLKDRYKLDCIVMKWKAGQGRTLIEKFEQEAQDAGFAFILMTPDDQIAPSEGIVVGIGNLGLPVKGNTHQYFQARPNVIFELGWFYGKLGRDRVCILSKEKTEIHSDLKGISQIIFNQSVEEKILDIEAELRAAGLI